MLAEWCIAFQQISLLILLICPFFECLYVVVNMAAGSLDELPFAEGV
jgi:hypothetical protein